MLNLHKRSGIIALLWVIISLLIQLPALHADQPNHLALTILYTNDIHGHLFPFDYNSLGRPETNVGGAARRATLIRKIKNESTNPVIVMDAGDVFTRGPLQDLEGRPDIDIMNAVPYDIMTLGNHEFDGDAYADNPGPKGLDILRSRIKQAGFSVVSANVVNKADGELLTKPYHIFDLGGIRIGVLGLTTPLTGRYRQCATLQFLDPIITAKRYLIELADKCDIIIVLSHLGILPDVELAYSVPNINVIIGGDTHTWVFKPMQVQNAVKTIICQNGEWGKTLGRLDLSICKTGSGKYEITNYSGNLIDIDSSIQPAKDVEAILQNYTKPYLTTIGTIDKDITQSNAPAWIAERLREATKTDIGFRPYDGVENGLAARPITELDLRKMVPWNNKVVVVRATGAQISKLMLQPNAAMVGAEIHDGQLYISNKKVDTTSLYTLASEDYYAVTSPALSGAQITKTDLSTRGILRSYVARHNQSNDNNRPTEQAISTVHG